MKKIIIPLLALLLLLTACGQKEPDGLRLNEDGSYAGFSDIPIDTVEQALARGSLVVDIDSFSSMGPQIYNRELWDTFVKKAEQGQNASLRVAVFSDGVGDYTDLYYEDGQYWLCRWGVRSVTGEATVESYSHLFRLEVVKTPWGTYGAETRVLYVLTNDTDMTADDFEWFGSQTSPSCDIPHAELDFMKYLN